MSSQPIGIFDSGIGGTSIMREVVKLLPNENIVYLADSKNAPYGQQSKSEIVNLCIKNVEFLLKANCKLIIVACNTATTNAIKELRNRYDIPFIGIEPAIKPAALNSKTQKIGVLATKGTLTSELFHKTSEQFSKHSKIIEVVGKGLVEHIEAGDFDSPQLQLLLKSFLIPLIKENIDYLVLGCSHYPYLIPVLTKMLPKSITIIDSGLAVANQTKQVLINNSLINTVSSDSQIVFFTNKNQNTIYTISEQFFKSSRIVLDLNI